MRVKAFILKTKNKRVNIYLGLFTLNKSFGFIQNFLQKCSLAILEGVKFHFCFINILSELLLAKLLSFHNKKQRQCLAGVGAV